MDIIVYSLIDAIKTIREGWEVFSRVWFIVLPVPFYYLLKTIWMSYRQREYARSLEYVLLEIIPPRDIERSPKPMESVFSGIAGVLKTFNPIEEFVKGMTTNPFSFEMAGFDGAVHFYIRMPKNYRNLIEAHVYAQYPDAEIVEASDYVDNVPKIVPNRELDLWGADFELVKPDPYPIRTYKYFEESITGEMIDPLAALVEVMGSLEPGQQIWFQCIMVPIHENWYNSGRALADELAGKTKKREGVLASIWGDLGDVINNVIPGLTQPVEFAKKEEKEQAPLEFRLTPGEKEILKALEANIGKYVFDTKMRFVYLGKRDNFSKANVSSFVGGIKQFADFNLNSFKPNERSKTVANFIFVDRRLRWRQRKIFKRYRDRDRTGKKVVLSSEELATVYHMPDMSVVAPGVIKTEFKRGGAPSNLPVK
ncbi:hypothetical protein BMS3Abin15_00560 [bacterium BMS3Abin15]|nr:hypothetical protein BMS3Abin15_00560 [bacterium BMS3Abin15]HDZ85099.1 hypothetical protein [Candidatus Moranbacteria bacterium]